MVFEQQIFPYQWLLVIKIQLLECKLYPYVIFESVILLPAQKELDHSVGVKFSYYIVHVLILLCFMALVEVITFVLQLNCILGEKKCIYTSAIARNVKCVKLIEYSWLVSVSRPIWEPPLKSLFAHLGLDS